MCVYMCMNEWESDLLSLTYFSTRPCKKRRLYCTSFSSVKDIPELEERLRLPVIVSVQDTAIPSATNRLIFVSRTQKEDTLSINWDNGIILRDSKMLTLLQRTNEVLSYCHLLLGLGFMEMMLQLRNQTRSNEAFLRNYPVIISAVKCKNLKAIYWFGWRACLCKEEVTIAVGNSLCFLKTEDMQEKQTLNLPLFFAPP